MVCVQCGNKTNVINSRPQKRSNQVWRRRECGKCSSVFSTTEIIDLASIWVVRSPTGGLKPFSRDKLALSLHRSCQHRKSSIDDAAALSDTVIARLASASSDGVIDSGQISRIIQVALSRFDKAASVHYQAFHKA